MLFSGPIKNAECYIHSPFKKLCPKLIAKKVRDNHNASYMCPSRYKIMGYIFPTRP